VSTTRKKEKNQAFLLVKSALRSSEGKWGKGVEEKLPHQNGPTFHANSGGLGASPSFGGSASRRFAEGRFAPAKVTRPSDRGTCVKLDSLSPSAIYN